MSKITTSNPNVCDCIENGPDRTTESRAYNKPELTRIGGLNTIRYKPGNGGDHNDGTYFRYRLS